MKRYLLLNKANVSLVSNLALQVGSVEKHPSNPLFQETHPWEQRFDNLYGNIVYDSEEGLYKCWYSPFIVAHRTTKMTKQQRLDIPFKAHPDQEMGVCYAESKDGICWSKPEVGRVGYYGKKNNNLVMRSVHGAGIFKDDVEEDPNRRYKMLCQGLQVGFSSNGIEWSPTQKINCELPGDTHNNAIWASSLQKYVGFTRDWHKIDRDLEGAETKTNHRWCRRVARIESEDFLHWSEAKNVLDADCWELQPYAMTVFPYADIYLGLLVIHDQVTDRAWTELTFSEDTVNWERIDSGRAFIGCGESELSYDYGCVYACARPVFLNNEVRFYYGGSDWLHFGWRKGCLALATMRPDGFAGYRQKDTDLPGRLVSKFFLYHGEEILVSADIKPRGFLITRLLDKSGVVVFEKKIAKTITDASVVPGMPHVTGKVQLEFIVSSAHLFSFALNTRK